MSHISKPNGPAQTQGEAIVGPEREDCLPSFAIIEFNTCWSCSNVQLLNFYEYTREKAHMSPEWDTIPQNVSNLNMSCSLACLLCRQLSTKANPALARILKALEQRKGYWNMCTSQRKKKLGHTWNQSTSTHLIHLLTTLNSCRH